MKRLLWMCACACLAACVTEDPGELLEEETGLEEVSGLEPLASGDFDIAAASDVGETSDFSPEGVASVWPEATTAAACHGTTTCTGTPGATWTTVFCGASTCTNQGCSPGCQPSDPDCEIRIARKQPREQYRKWTRSDGSECREYRPYIPYMTCTCDI
jgi:hypothetical protein